MEEEFQITNIEKTTDKKIKRTRNNFLLLIDLAASAVFANFGADLVPLIDGNELNTKSILTILLAFANYMAAFIFLRNATVELLRPSKSQVERIEQEMKELEEKVKKLK